MNWVAGQFVETAAAAGVERSFGIAAYSTSTEFDTGYLQKKHSQMLFEEWHQLLRVCRRHKSNAMRAGSSAALKLCSIAPDASCLTGSAVGTRCHSTSVT